MDWLREFEPQCADGGRGARVASSRIFSRCSTSRTAARGSSRRTAGRWSAKRASSPIRSTRRARTSSPWATTTSTDLIVRDARGEDIAARAEAFNATYLRLFDAFIRLYDGQYPIMGNAQVMTAKVAWDNACYWAITALLFFQRRLPRARVHRVDRSADAPVLRPARPHAAAVLARGTAPTCVRLRQRRRQASCDVDFLRSAAGGARRPACSTTIALRERLTANFAILDQLARGLQDLASEAARLEPVLHPAMATGERLNLDALRLQPHAAAIHA